MEDKFKLAIEEYQCTGCICGRNISCFEPNTIGGIGCGKHTAGTIGSFIGSFFLGMPKGFDRLGAFKNVRPTIYDTFKSSDWIFDKWNIPVWKYLSKEGHTFVRGFMPRRSEPFIHVYLENCLDKIDCLEISQEDVDYMD